MNEPRRFETTSWTLILNARSGDESSRRDALGSLIETYWQPLYGFLRSRGFDSPQAADMTQGFFTHLLEKNILGRVVEGQGKFRTFLLTCVQNYANNQFDREQAAKRGGQFVRVDLDVSDAESRLQLSNRERAPEVLFDQEWAHSLLKRVHQRLQAVSPTPNRPDVQAAIAGFLTADPQPGEYESLAADLGMTVVGIRVAVHRLRERFRQELRAEVALTLGPDDDVDEEIQYLITVLKAGKDGV